MEKEKVKQLLTQADAALNLASEERMRPEEDVVPFSICHNSRLSIRMYLMSYLIKHGITPDNQESVTELLKKCAKIDDRFASLNVAEIACGHHKGDQSSEYCLSVNKVSNCYEAANEVKKMVLALF